MAVSAHKADFLPFCTVKFILGGYAYVFTDTGADTMQINYAQYGLFSSLFRSGEKWLCATGGTGKWMYHPIIRHI